MAGEGEKVWVQDGNTPSPCMGKTLAQIPLKGEEARSDLCLRFECCQSWISTQKQAVLAACQPLMSTTWDSHSF